MDQRSMTGNSVLRESLSELLGSEAAVDVIKRLGPERLATVNGALLEILANVPEAELDVVPGDFKRQDSILPGVVQPKSGIRLIRVKEGASELALPVVGLALALFRLIATGDPAELPIPFLETAKVFWGNIVTLRPPHDDDAIAVVRCLAEAGAKEVLVSGQRPGIDTSTLATSSGINGERLNAALIRLHHLDLIRAEWAGGEDSFADPRNTWKLSL